MTSVKYKNSAGTETTMTVDTQYIVDADSNVGRIVLPYGITWPSFTAYTVNPITITYVAGYTDIPKAIKQSILLLAAYWYEHREAITTGFGQISKEAEFTTSALLSQYRVRWF